MKASFLALLALAATSFAHKPHPKPTPKPKPTPTPLPPALSPEEVIAHVAALSEHLTELSDDLPPCYRRSAPSIDPDFLPNTPGCVPYIDYLSNFVNYCDGATIPGGNSTQNQALLNVICFCRFGVDEKYPPVFTECAEAICPVADWPGELEHVMGSFNNITAATFEQCPKFLPSLAEYTKTGFEIDAGDGQMMEFEPMVFKEGYWDFTTAYPTPTPTKPAKPTKPIKTKNPKKPKKVVKKPGKPCWGHKGCHGKEWWRYYN